MGRIRNGKTKHGVTMVSARQYKKADICRIIHLNYYAVNRCSITIIHNSYSK